MANDSTNNGGADDAERAHKVQALREMVQNAERTIQSAKAMLLQLEGKKKSGRPRKHEDDEGTVVEGTFDGQTMVGTDGKQYPVPANYASKSKLVEGDMLKLTITEDGSFIYKQIGPVERKHAIGVVTQDENGNYYVVADGRPLRVLLASITYFKALPGDEVAVVLPRDIEPAWAALENIMERGAHKDWEANLHQAVTANDVMNKWKDTFVEGDVPKPVEKPQIAGDPHFLDAWVRDMEELEKEVKEEKPDAPASS